VKHSKIAIIGAGSVGSTTAYALSLKQIAAEIVLIDTDQKRCAGEILDLSDIRGLIPTSRVKKGTIADTDDADIIVIAAGKRQNIGQSRRDLYQANKEIIRSICEHMGSIRNDAIVIMVTNPVDPLTRIAQQNLPLPEKQIFGSGTLLDSLRVRKYIGEYVSICPQSVDALVLGEHGDSHVVLWSLVSIGGMPLDFSAISDAVRRDIEQKTKNEVYDIISCKGATFFGVATCIVRMCEAIIFDEQVILPVSCFLEKENVCVSLPVVLGKQGIVNYVPLHMSASEQEQMECTIQCVKQYTL